MTPTIPPTYEPSGSMAAVVEEYVPWRDYKPRGNGFFDLVDDILAYVVENRARIVWVRELVTEFPLDGGTSRSLGFAYRNSVARAVIARLAALCEVAIGNPFHPYRGEGSFTDPRWPHVRFFVEFSNSSAELCLELTPVFSSEPS